MCKRKSAFTFWEFGFEMGILQSNGRCQPLHYGKCRIVCFFDGISASFASILAFSFPSSSLKCSETSLEFFFHLNMSTPNLTLKKLKAHYAGFASCCFFKHAGCRKRSCRRMVDFGVSFSVSTYSQVLLCWQTLPLQHRAAPAVRRSSAAPPPRTPASDARAPAAAPRCRTESHPAEGDAVKTVMDDDKVTDQACCHCTNWREIDVMAWDVRWSVYEKAQECGTQREACSRHTLPSPCAVFPPPHPGCSQTTPRRRWRPDDSSASPPVPQSAIPETRFAPRNNEPKGHKVRTGLCCVCIRIHCFTAEGTWRADVSLGAETVFVLTSSISRTRRSLRAAMTVRSWTNRVRPSLLSSLAATKSNLSQSHLSTAAPLRGHTEPETGLNSERSDRRWLELIVVDWKK